MNGKLQQDIIDSFKASFENNCIHLLLDAYTTLRNSGRRLNEETENNITVQLFGLMKSNPSRSNLQIHLERESYLDSDETFDGLLDADTSPRIDIKYSVWNSDIEIDYYMEAKNLSENNWKKQSTNASIYAAGLRKRYIKTGIDSFISGRYINGCLVGYVIEGKIIKIVKLLNQLLIQIIEVKKF